MKKTLKIKAQIMVADAKRQVFFPWTHFLHCNDKNQKDVEDDG